MKAEDFVKAHYPNSLAVKMKRGKLKYMQTTYYLVYDRFGGNRLGCGDTKAQAYKDAKELIDERIKLTNG